LRIAVDGMARNQRDGPGGRSFARFDKVEVAPQPRSG
jgi:hypothetical protein